MHGHDSAFRRNQWGGAIGVKFLSFFFFFLSYSSFLFFFLNLIYLFLIFLFIIIYIYVSIKKIKNEFIVRWPQLRSAAEWVWSSRHLWQDELIFYFFPLLIKTGFPDPCLQSSLYNYLEWCPDRRIILEVSVWRFNSKILLITDAKATLLTVAFTVGIKSFWF